MRNKFSIFNNQFSNNVQLSNFQLRQRFDKLVIENSLKIAKLIIEN